VTIVNDNQNENCRLCGNPPTSTPSLLYFYRQNQLGVEYTYEYVYSALLRVQKQRASDLSLPSHDLRMNINANKLKHKIAF